MVDASRLGWDSRQLAEPLLRCFGTGQIELSMAPSLFTTPVPDRPKATAYARLQAETSNGATNLRHEYVRLSGFERHVLRYLDGTIDRGSLVDRLEAAVASGELIFREGDAETSGSGNGNAASLDRALERSLITLTRRCFILDT